MFEGKRLRVHTIPLTLLPANGTSFEDTKTRFGSRGSILSPRLCTYHIKC